MMYPEKGSLFLKSFPNLVGLLKTMDDLEENEFQPGNTSGKLLSFVTWIIFIIYLLFLAFNGDKITAYKFPSILVCLINGLGYNLCLLFQIHSAHV